MDSTTYDEYVSILHEELVCALGCTEPIAVAYAAALARAALGAFPRHLDVSCSGNIIKKYHSKKSCNHERFQNFIFFRFFEFSISF